LAMCALGSREVAGGPPVPAVGPMTIAMLLRNTAISTLWPKKL
jgi:5,10-methylene-tetrahydrofolate dehydrogenase/methenyl tetrahydrofolate cyclohydrolase